MIDETQRANSSGYLLTLSARIPRPFLHKPGYQLHRRHAPTGRGLRVLLNPPRGVAGQDVVGLQPIRLPEDLLRHLPAQPSEDLQQPKLWVKGCEPVASTIMPLRRSSAAWWALKHARL